MVGSVVAAAVVFRRDRPRAVACLVGPALALVTCELVVKPAVGRTLGGVYSYPSGSTVGAAALATVAVLATTARWRAATVVVASLVSLWMWTAVVFLHWHYPDRRAGRPGLRGRRGAGDRRGGMEGRRRTGRWIRRGPGRSPTRAAGPRA